MNIRSVDELMTCYNITFMQSFPGKTGHSLHIILPIVSVVVVGLVVAACVYLIKKHGWLDWLTLCSKVKSRQV